MFTPSIYQFITSPRERPEEEKVDDNENSKRFWSGLGGTETDYAWVIISSSVCETILIPVAAFILDILPFTAPLSLLMLMYAVGGALYASATEVWMAMLARGMMGGAGLFAASVLYSYIGEMGTIMDEIRKKKGKRPLKNVLYMAAMFALNGANVLVLGAYAVFARIPSLNPYRSPGWFLTSLALLSVTIILLLYTEPRPWTCRKKCSRCSCKTGLGFSLKLRSKAKVQVILIVFVFACAYVNGQTLSVVYTLVAPILSDQFGFSVANTSLYFVALAVGCFTASIIQ
jgi:predicted MFS family arabinose efflux permease